MKSFIVFLFAVFLFVVVFVRPVEVDKTLFIRRSPYEYYDVNGELVKYEDLHTGLSEKWILDMMKHYRKDRSSAGWGFGWPLEQVKLFGITVSLLWAVFVLFALVVAFWIVKRCWTKHCTKKQSVLPEYIKSSMVSDKY